MPRPLGPLLGVALAARLLVVGTAHHVEERRDLGVVARGGSVICSGIRDYRRAAVERAAVADGWRVTARTRQADWVGVQLAR